MKIIGRRSLMVDSSVYIVEMIDEELAKIMGYRSYKHMVGQIFEPQMEIEYDATHPSYESSLRVAEKQVDEQNVEIEKHGQRIRDLENRYKDLKGKLHSIRGLVAFAGNDIAKGKEKISDAKDSITEALKKIDPIIDEIGEL